MLVVTRYRVAPESAVSFRDQALAALEVLAGCPGWTAGHLGRAVDDPALWVLTTEWANTGSYRRALSSYDVKLTVVPLLSGAIDEPTAFESITGTDDGSRAADADEVGPGSAAAPVVPTDLNRGTAR